MSKEERWRVWFVGAYPTEDMVMDRMREEVGEVSIIEISVEYQSREMLGMSLA